MHKKYPAEAAIGSLQRPPPKYLQIKLHLLEPRNSLPENFLVEKVML